MLRRQLAAAAAGWPFRLQKVSHYCAAAAAYSADAEGCHEIRLPAAMLPPLSPLLLAAS